MFYPLTLRGRTRGSNKTLNGEGSQRKSVDIVSQLLKETTKGTAVVGPRSGAGKISSLQFGGERVPNEGHRVGSFYMHFN